MTQLANSTLKEKYIPRNLNDFDFCSLTPTDLLQVIQDLELVKVQLDSS